MQGGPLEHVIAAKAVAFGEALQPSFKSYQQAVLDNARALAASLKKGALDPVSGGTDGHLVRVDLRPPGVSRRAAALRPEHARMTCNKNAIPFAPAKPTITSGIRVGSPAATTRGFGVQEFEIIGQYMVEVLDGLVKNGAGNNTAVEKLVGARVLEMCEQF